MKIMKQILCNSSGALVARMPVPVAAPGQVLVRVHYSLISAGTELASLRPDPSQQSEKTIEKVAAKASLARRYLGLAAQNPEKAVKRVYSIVKNSVRRFRPSPGISPRPVCTLNSLPWTQVGAVDFKISENCLKLVTDESEFGYQAVSGEIPVSQGMIPVFHIKGKVITGTVSIGLLDEKKTAWIGSRKYDEGMFEDRLIFDPGSSSNITMVVAKAGDKVSATLELSEIDVFHCPPTIDGKALSELDDQGWNVGYSAAGEVLVVGEGVTGFKKGDIVACAGAGLANHAEFVAVPGNLVCKIPSGCGMREAATTTVGTIALQGVRRASPQLGEKICVIGLGLIGQMTVQILRASGCTVIGSDLDEKRVERALQIGMEVGHSNTVELKKIVNDLTENRGVDRTIITAATKSDAVINLAMEITRAKGRVVIVGDIGMNIDRSHFYRKEIDLLMSTSYGPGRYDSQYEFEGLDYPFAYVRWTLNRNMSAYMELISSKRIDITALIDKVVHVDEAPDTYKQLAGNSDSQPLAVLIQYPDGQETQCSEKEKTSITIGGHRPTPNGPLRYALVGAGAFGTCMLVPQMAKRKDRFFLRAVVSRDTTRGGNFARSNQVEILATDIDAVLMDTDIDLVVIATRHNEHAGQVKKCLAAGKHVFVEKPLALSWKELAEIDEMYSGLEKPPFVMVGFNRRFSPALVKLREIIANRRSPLIINYRLNGGYIPPDHWIQTKVGGGRNIGEACHMYDVFRSLAGAPVRSISAMAISSGNLSYLSNDNFSANLSYEDGSVGNLVYTSLGPKQGLPKEYIEVFCDGEAYIIDDYKLLKRCSDNSMLWQSSNIEKGHFLELSLFGDGIHSGQGSPIPFSEIMETTAVSLAIEDQIFGREQSA